MPVAWSEFVRDHLPVYARIKEDGMAKMSGDKMVVGGREPKPTASFDELKKIANEQSPLSQRDPETYAKGK